ncbi:type 1 fimbrial major subunit FimA [Pectobacterium aroidearum]|uniref:type 1 fimbrial major subunit FimA n=1 Tax=Pectobacterium aroidearum TaxID=1201031 RepID=UPI001CD3ED13|nr:type 1 fimbrial major subunit FimA [Pectobacterium aroidearum]
MHKSLLNTLIGASLLSSSVTVFAATVAGGTVHFKGEIVNAACAVSTNTADQIVNLGQYRTARFTGVGTYSGKVPFTINLEDCDSTVSTTAAVAFTGTADSNDNTVLAVSNIGGGASGAAGGVGIEISDRTGAVLTPNGSVYSAPQTLNDGSNVLAFNARYKATQATTTPGAADADATFTIDYQ